MRLQTRQLWILHAFGGFSTRTNNALPNTGDNTYYSQLSLSLSWNAIMLD